MNLILPTTSYLFDIMLHLFDNIPKYVQNPAISAYLTENGLDVFNLQNNMNFIYYEEFTKLTNIIFDNKNNELGTIIDMVQHI